MLIARRTVCTAYSTQKNPGTFLWIERMHPGSVSAGGSGGMSLLLRRRGSVAAGGSRALLLNTRAEHAKVKRLRTPYLSQHAPR